MGETEAQDTSSKMTQQMQALEKCVILQTPVCTPPLCGISPFKLRK